MLRILIADDYRPIRKRLKQILEEEFQDIYIEEAEDAEQLLAKAAAAAWNMVISDFSMPGRGGLESLRMIKKQHPQIPVLMLSTYPEEQFALRLLLAGASGYLSKGAGPEIIIRAIKTILNGERYLTPGIHVPVHLLLSHSEELVCKRLMRGEQIENVAASLQLADKDALVIQQNLLKKMNLSSVQQLILYARENNLV